MKIGVGDLILTRDKKNKKLCALVIEVIPKENSIKFIYSYEGVYNSWITLTYAVSKIEQKCRGKWYHYPVVE